MNDIHLPNIRILVTRPKEQAKIFAQDISATGASAVCVPVLKIIPVAVNDTLQQYLQRLEQFDLAIFISVNAVIQGLRLLKGAFPEALSIAVIGRSTAEMIAQMLHRPADICPEKAYHSEGLLALDALQQMQGKKIIIFRGVGGREFLRQRLLERGAEVDYIEVYQRAVPTDQTLYLQKIVAHDGVDIVTVSSAEGLRNLYSMLDKKGQAWLLTKHIVIPTPRMLDLVKQMGFLHSPILADSATNQSMLHAINQWKHKG